MEREMDRNIDPATVLVTEILAELVTSSLFQAEIEVDTPSPSCNMSFSSESLPILDVGVDGETKTEGAVRESLTVVEKVESARRVARKSSRPPLNPQRPGAVPGLSQEERLLLESSERPSTKRKSSRPPLNPQRPG